MFILRQMSEELEIKKLIYTYISKIKDTCISLERRGVERLMIEIIKTLYNNNINKVKIQMKNTKIGLKQGCVLSLLLL